MTIIKTMIPAALVVLAGCNWLNEGEDGGKRGVDIAPPSSQSSALVYYDSCDQLLTDLRGSLETEMTARLLNADRYYSVGFDDAEGAMDGSTEPTTSEGDLANGGGAEAGGERVEGEDFSGTNNQEEGVDEADFVKDEYHIYAN